MTPLDELDKAEDSLINSPSQVTPPILRFSWQEKLIVVVGSILFILAAYWYFANVL